MKQNHILRTIKTMIARRTIKNIASKSISCRIILGAGGTCHNGWISTDYPELDIANEQSWLRIFNPDTLDALLAEHVFEHLSYTQAEVALIHSYNFLKDGGYLRIAVPDGFHPDEQYINQVKPGGYGAGAGDHKVLYNYKTLKRLIEKVGFRTRLLEWFDQTGKFNFIDWQQETGFIKRSSRFDSRNRNKKLNYTSLIIDAIKP